jgi:DNA polymerase
MRIPKYVFNSQVTKTQSDSEEPLEGLLKEIEYAQIPYKDLENTVFSDGDRNSPVMIIGEAPGESEVAQKKPFVGRSGTLLNEMLECAGILRDKIYITNAIVWRPPSNRTPLPDEIEAMRPYLLKHIRIIDPKLILIVGGVAYKCITAKNIAISKIRGQWEDFEGRRCLCIFHPSYLLRSPIHRKSNWFDILRFRQGIIEAGYANILTRGAMRISRVDS